MLCWRCYMQRYFAKDRLGDNLILQDSDLHHIKNVMRMKVDDEIEVIYDKILYICRVGDLSINEFSIVKRIDEDNEMNVEVTVAVSLVKEQKMDLILQKLTELGVKRIIPLKIERSIIKLDEKKYKKKKERWLNICKEACEQSKRNVIPEITDIKTVKELDGDYELKFVCSVKNKENLINKYLQENKEYAKIIFVIGSEGGITDREEQILNDNGFVSVSLGKRVLRVETAAIYVASILNFCNM